MSSTVDKILKLMKKPQEEGMAKLADMSGAKRGKDSEETAFNVVDKTAEKLGIPEDSKIGRAGKAAAVAGLEYFADPNPVQKLLKPLTRGYKTVSKIIDKLPKKESAAQAYKAAKESGKGVAVVETAQELADRKNKEKMMKVIRLGKELK